MGCGVGLPATVALSRAADVVVSDQYEAAMDFAAHNARENVGREPETFMLDWRCPELNGIGLFDLIIAADVLYEALSGLALAEIVPQLLAPQGEVVFADPRRNTAPVFVDGMEERGFEASTESATVDQGGKEVEILLHRLRR